MFTHIHTSSRFDRADVDFRKALASYFDSCDLLTLTEVSAERRERILRGEAQTAGFGTLTGDRNGSDDCGVAWKLSRFTKTWGATVRIGTATAKDVHPFVAVPPSAACVVLQDSRTGLRMLVSVLHTPAGVEFGNGFRDGAVAVRLWLARQRAWRKVWNDLAREHNVDAILICADWNVDIKRPFFRALFQRIQPGMKPTLRYRALPKRGTHGHRLIDFSFIRGRLRVWRPPVILRHDGSSDHSPFLEVLAFTRP